MTTFGSGTFGGGTFGAFGGGTSVAEPTSLERLTAEWMLPPWVTRGERGFLAALLAALGTELDSLRDQHRRIGAQAFIPEADFALADWERQLGLPVNTALSIEERRTRLLARRLGFGRPIGPKLRDLVRVLTGQTDLPEVFVASGLWTVFKLAARGWPGDAAFLEAERRLFRSGPAAFGNHVAAWDDVLGLTFGQMDLMTWEAIETLTWTEINGGALAPPPPEPGEEAEEAFVGLGMPGED